MDPPQGNKGFRWTWPTREGSFGREETPGPPPAAVDFAPGALLDGSYRVLEEVGRGGMGVVLRALDVHAHREVALKFVLVDLSERLRERFLREGQVTAGLRDPGIVQIHACGEHEGRPYLVYELVEDCRTLDEVLPVVGLRQRVALIREAARALGVAHRSRVVHRDVKPGNILVTGVDRVRVADFGLALTETADRLTRTGELVGTPAYMAPEQLSGKSRETTPATDVWALGVILYEALSNGRMPFPGATLLELMGQILSGRVPPLSAANPEAPRELVEVCLRCLRLEPAERYPDGAALAEALSEALSGGAAARRAPGKLAGLALVGVTALAWGLAAMQGEREAPPRPVRVGQRPVDGGDLRGHEPQARAPTDFNVPRLVLREADSRVRSARLLDDEHVLLSVQRGRSHSAELWRASPESEPARLWVLEKRGSELLFEAGVQRCHALVSAGPEHSRRWVLVDRSVDGLRGQAPSFDPTKDLALAQDEAWARLGRGTRGLLVATVGDDRRLRLHGQGPDGWELRWEHTLRDRLGDALFSPGGELLAVVVYHHSAGKGLRVYEVETGKLVSSPLPVQTQPYGLAFSPDGQRLVLRTKRLALLRPSRGEADWRRLVSAAGRAVPRNDLGATVESHPGSRIRDVTFLSNGRLVSVASETDLVGANEVRFWDAEEGADLGELSLLGQPRAYTWVAVAPSGRTLVTGGEDFWEVRDLALLEAGR